LGFAMFGAMHQDYEVLSVIAFIVAGIIDFPIIILYGADPNPTPPVFVSIAIYLLEAGVISFFIYVVRVTRKK
jgi:hypothetical protein